MKRRLMELLACPACGTGLELCNSKPDPDGTDEIGAGELVCRSCSAEYPIRGGVPRLLLPDLSAAALRTSAAFGWQWQEFVELYDEYEAQFLDWIHPIQPDFFKDKLVLDAGCGNGRHAFYAARYGAREVVAMDLSDAVDTAYANVGKLPNTHVIQADIYHPPFRRPQGGGPFDFIYSIGVLHHLPDPEGGFQSVIRFLRPGAAIFAWVYGRENNGIVHGLIDPLRKGITARIPPSMLPAIAWPMTVALHTVVKGIYRPLHATRMFRALPSREYLYSLSSFSFRRNYNIVFDHLVAPVAFYLRREEFEGWFQRSNLGDVRISWRNKNSWRGFGRVSNSAPTSYATEP